MKLTVLDNKKPDCISNLNICKASCCRSVSFNVTGNKGTATNVLNFKTLTEDMKHYYELHGFTIKRHKDRSWNLIIPEEMFKNVIMGERPGNETFMRVPSVCQALTSENKCSLHGTPEKPFCCTDLNQETAHNYYLTEGCIFK